MQPGAFPQASNGVGIGGVAQAQRPFQDAARGFSTGQQWSGHWWCCPGAASFPRCSQGLFHRPAMEWALVVLPRECVLSKMQPGAFPQASNGVGIGGVAQAQRPMTVDSTLSTLSNAGVQTRVWSQLSVRTDWDSE